MVQLLAAEFVNEQFGCGFSGFWSWPRTVTAYEVTAEENSVGAVQLTVIEPSVWIMADTSVGAEGTPGVNASETASLVGLLEYPVASTWTVTVYRVPGLSFEISQ